MNSITITRMHGLGNVVLLADASAFDDPGCPPADLLAALPGLGADALIVHGSSEGDGRWMRTWNLDGSEAELCGNGLRCLVLCCVENGLLDGDGATVDSPCCRHEVRLEPDASVTVSMPSPGFGADAVGMSEGSLPASSDGAGCVDVTIGEQPRCLHLVSTGNPHAILCCRDESDLDEIDAIGPFLEGHAAFPDRINVHLALPRGRDVVILRSWERGVGPTKACATGATAAVAALCRAGMVDSTCRVEMPGGALVVRWNEDTGRTFNTGSAEHIDELVVPIGEETGDHAHRTL